MSLNQSGAATKRGKQIRPAPKHAMRSHPASSPGSIASVLAQFHNGTIKGEGKNCWGVSEKQSVAGDGVVSHHLTR